MIRWDRWAVPEICGTEGENDMKKIVSAKFLDISYIPQMNMALLLFMLLFMSILFILSNIPPVCSASENAGAKNIEEAAHIITESILTSYDKTAAIALRTATSDIPTGYACLLKLIPRINEAKGGLDTAELVKEDLQPKFLCCIPQDRYHFLQTRKGTILARFADFIRESENPPLRYEAQKLLLNAFFNELKEEPAKDDTSEIMNFAFRCVLFDEFVEPSSGGDLLLSFIENCLGIIERLDRNTRSRLDTGAFNIAICMKDHRDAVTELRIRIHPYLQLNQNTDIVSGQGLIESILKRGQPISEEQYRGLCNMTAQELVNQLESIQYTLQYQVIAEVIIRHLCGTRKLQCKNWEPLWKFICSGKPSLQLYSSRLFNSLASPLPISGTPDEKAHFDTLVEYFYNIAATTSFEDTQKIRGCVGYLRKMAIQEDLDIMRSSNKEIPEMYGQTLVLNKLLLLLKSNNIWILLDTLNEISYSCSWLNYETAQSVNQHLKEFQLQMPTMDWKKIATRYPDPERDVNSAFESAMTDNSRALRFFASEQEKSEIEK